MEVAKKYGTQLERIKENVRQAYEYFKPNYDRYNEFRRFVFDSSLRDEEVTLLTTLSKPQLEFNVLEAYISRLLGEFSKQEPDIAISADDENTADPAVIKVVEQHLRHVLTDASNHNVRYETYKDLLSGGFSVMKVTTDYANPRSFNQVINIRRVFDPTLCGFDHLARDCHKGDGRFCFELFPMAEEVFKEEYPNISIEKFSFRREFAGFNWSYSNDSTKFVIVADYYEKKKKKEKIVQLVTGQVITMKEYNELVANWSDLTVPPGIVGKPRMTDLETICRYRIIENQVLEYEETDFTMFPLVFVDGASILIKTPKNGNVRQMTRPYVYHAKGAQRLKNFAGISLANEIENIVQHKFIIKQEALPQEEAWLEAIRDIQKPSNIVVNAFFDQNPNQPIPDPIREIAKPPAPPEILQAFTGADSTIQNVLGSYDASLGINNNQLSGKAIEIGALQSNSASMPYIVGFLSGLQRIAHIYVDLLPKYYTTPRTLPVMDEEGNRSYIQINTQDSPNMFFDANALNVIVRAGASFQVQKSRTIMMVKEMMGMSPLFSQFIAEKGLNFVLDNLEGRGIEQLKQMVEDWVRDLEQQKQMQMQAQQQESQFNPALIKLQLDAQRLEHEIKKDELGFQIEMMKMDMEKQHIASNMERDRENNLVQIAKLKTERDKAHANAHLKGMDIHLKHQTKQPKEGTGHHGENHQQ